jgi:hypothetical protein
MPEVTLLELQNSHCRYITRAGFYCGEPRIPDKKTSYCREHHAVCWTTARGTYLDNKARRFLLPRR